MVRNILLILVMIPFWSNFLVRTYAWKVLLGTDGPVSQLSQALGGEPIRLLFTNTAVLIGLVYGFLPFMVLPLYAALERMDWSLVEAARDLYAGGWTAFRKVTWPLSLPGVIAGSILVFIPTLGAYVTPAILGGAKTTLAGDHIVSQFLAARNQPFGSALSMGMMFIMLSATIISSAGFAPRGRPVERRRRNPSQKSAERLLATNSWLVFRFYADPVLVVFSFSASGNVGIWTDHRCGGTARSSRTRPCSTL
jgi:ABC-type spermidine/putrescine transport system permease subunit I